MEEAQSAMAAVPPPPPMTTPCVTGTAAEKAPPPPPLPPMPPPPPPPPPPPQAATAAAAAAGGGAAVDDDAELSLRQSLEQLAAGAGLVFLPTSSQHEGKRVFLFGKVACFVDPDKKLVCARLPSQTAAGGGGMGGGGFQPTSLSKLVEAASAAGE
jgi:hypothetical protein